MRLALFFLLIQLIIKMQKCKNAQKFTASLTRFFQNEPKINHLFVAYLRNISYLCIENARMGGASAIGASSIALGLHHPCSEI